MAEKKFTQKDSNRIVAYPLKRERERTIKEYENSLKRCMAAVHLTLYQEMCSLKNELNAEMKNPLWPSTEQENRDNEPAAASSLKSEKRGGERQ